MIDLVKNIIGERIIVEYRLGAKKFVIKDHSKDCDDSEYGEDDADSDSLRPGGRLLLLLFLF